MVAVRRKTIEEIITEVQRVAALIGRPPTGNDWAEHKAWGFTEALRLKQQGYPWPKLLAMAGFEITEQQAKLGRRAISPEQVEGARLAMMELRDENGAVPQRRWKERHGGHPGTYALKSYHNTRDWLVVLERMGFHKQTRQKIKARQKIKKIPKDASTCNPAKPSLLYYVNGRVTASDFAAILVAAARAGEPGNISAGMREAFQLVNPTPAEMDAAHSVMKDHRGARVIFRERRRAERKTRKRKQVAPVEQLAENGFSNPPLFQGENSVLVQLTRREQMLLSEIGQGKGTEAISQAVGLQRSSVIQYLNTIRAKLRRAGMLVKPTPAELEQVEAQS